MATPATGTLLEVRGISKRFGGYVALQDVTLCLAAGEVHAVAGENGAGKATLMAILSGTLRPDAGALFWEGAPVAPGDVRAAQALGISMVHQELGKLAGTVAQNPRAMGQQGVESALAALEGRPVEKRIDTGTELVTKENAEKYLR